MARSHQTPLERFVLGKAFDEKSDVLVVLDALGIPHNLTDAAARGRVSGIVGGFPVAGYWSEILRLPDPTIYGWDENSEAARKAEARARKGTIEGWKTQAKAQLGGIDPKIKQGAERLIKGAEVGSSKVRDEVYAMIGVSDELRAALVEPAPRGDRSHDAWEDWQNRKFTARGKLRALAARFLGIELPEEREARIAWETENGFRTPPKPTGYKLGAWTCTGCFETHAVTAGGEIVHHGYERPGWGHIVGDCIGVGHVAWERGTGALPNVLNLSVHRSESFARDLRTGFGGRLSVKTDRPRLDNDGKPMVTSSGRKLFESDQIGPDDPRWPEAERAARERAQRVLARLWSREFLGIPWIRAAIRGWTPSAQGPVGMPDVVLVPEDYAGMPPEAELAPLRAAIEAKRPDLVTVFDEAQVAVVQAIKEERERDVAELEPPATTAAERVELARLSWGNRDFTERSAQIELAKAISARPEYDWKIEPSRFNRARFDVNGYKEPDRQGSPHVEVRDAVRAAGVSLTHWTEASSKEPFGTEFAIADDLLDERVLIYLKPNGPDAWTMEIRDDGDVVLASGPPENAKALVKVVREALATALDLAELAAGEDSAALDAAISAIPATSALAVIKALRGRLFLSHAIDAVRWPTPSRPEARFAAGLVRDLGRVGDDLAVPPIVVAAGMVANLLEDRLSSRS